MRSAGRARPAAQEAIYDRAEQTGRRVTCTTDHDVAGNIVDNSSAHPQRIFH
ncbi:hypothetical protein RLIN73S_07465 [Rhodanobacter lindaniclasticus]